MGWIIKLIQSIQSFPFPKKGKSSYAERQFHFKHPQTQALLAIKRNEENENSFETNKRLKIDCLLNWSDVWRGENCIEKVHENRRE